jgi:glycerol uptake facilitator-like aquaporin
VALVAMRKFSWKKALVYIPGQYLGGFLGAALVYAIYYEGISNYEYDFRKLAYEKNLTFDKISLTGGIFATYPQSYLSVGEVLADQIFSCALLMIGILAITDEKGINTPRALQPISLALVLTAIIISYGFNCGATLNPGNHCL